MDMSAFGRRFDAVAHNVHNSALLHALAEAGRRRQPSSAFSYTRVGGQKRCPDLYAGGLAREPGRWFGLRRRKQGFVALALQKAVSNTVLHGNYV
jgi:hypothetical protein